jgi:hypothetical protein
LIFLDESNKPCINEYYYVSAILITTSETFLDVFRDIVDRHRRNNFKELKFKKMSRFARINFLNDLNRYRQKFFIYVERTRNAPIIVIRNILDNYPLTNTERILFIDENFLTPNELQHLKEQRIDIRVKKSSQIPGIQIADTMAGSFRLWGEDKDMELLTIILNKLCKISIHNLIPRS